MAEPTTHYDNGGLNDNYDGDYCNYNIVIIMIIIIIIIIIL